MQVILREDYPSLGFVGDTVNVKPGFARNFLYPQKIALPANHENAKLLAHQKRLLEVKKSQKKSEAESYKKRVDGVKVSIEHAAHGEKLFGSVTTSEIQEKLKENNIEIDRKLIKLEAPIKRVGEYTVIVKLHQDVAAEIKVEVLAKEEAHADEDEKPAKKAKSKEEKKAKAEENSEENESAETNAEQPQEEASTEES